MRIVSARLASRWETGSIVSARRDGCTWEMPERKGKVLHFDTITNK